MRALSSNTRTLIERLYKRVSVLEKLTGSWTDDELLTEIGISAEPAAIAYIFPFVLATSRRVAAAAVTAIHRLTSITSPVDLASLDSVWRERRPFWLECDKLTPAGLNRLEGFGDASPFLLGMASFHESGYVREEAIKRLDLIESGVEVPFLLIRLNDWVPNVRDAAHKAISARLTPAYCRSLIANLPLVSRLEQTGRVDSHSVIKAINEVLQSAECRPVLLEAFNSNDRFIRRTSFRLALESIDPDLPELLRQALGDDDTVVRLLAAKRVSSAFEGAALDQILAMMRLDRFLPVRREALRICVNRDLEQCRAELSSALLDKHASMRQEARYYLRQFDSPDFASLYRKALSAGDERTLYSALSGLGETGSAEDDVLLVSYTSHSTAKIRRAAIKALARLNGSAHLRVLMEALADEVPSVSREALKGLAAHASLVGNERLWEILCVTSHSHVRRNALSLLGKLGKWVSIYFMVKATSASDEEVAARARLSIQRWLSRFNGTFYAPTPEQVIRLMSVLEESGSHLDENTKQHLRFCIKGF